MTASTPLVCSLLFCPAWCNPHYFLLSLLFQDSTGCKNSPTISVALMSNNFYNASWETLYALIGLPVKPSQGLTMHITPLRGARNTVPLCLESPESPALMFTTQSHTLSGAASPLWTSDREKQRQRSSGEKYDSCSRPGLDRGSSPGARGDSILSHLS